MYNIYIAFGKESYNYDRYASRNSQCDYRDNTGSLTFDRG